jgi:phage gp29-like protein
MFFHPKLQTSRFIKDPKDIKQAEQMANLVDEKRRDTRYLMSLLSSMQLVHGPLQRHIERLKTLIVSPDWSIMVYQDDNEAEELAIAAKRRLSAVMPHAFQTFIDGMLYGISLSELNYRNTNIGFIPELVRHFHCTEIEYNPDYFQKVAVLLESQNGFTRNEIKEANFANFLSYHDTSRQQRGGLLLSVIYQVLALNVVEQEWIQFIQKLKGIIQAIVTTGATKEEREIAEEAVKKANSVGAFSATDRVNFALHKIADAASGDNFDKFQKQMREDIEVTITGTSSLASDKERNALTMQERNAQDIAIWGRRNFMEWINKTLIRYDYYLNVNRDLDAEIPYTFAWQIKEEEDREANARIIETLLNNGASIKVSEIEAKTGIILADDSENVIKVNNQIVPPLLDKDETPDEDDAE